MFHSGRVPSESIPGAGSWARRMSAWFPSIPTWPEGGKQWMNARGWTCYTSRGQTAGDRLSDCLYRAAALWLPGHKLRKDYSDEDPDWESDFYILKNTLCAAALTETLFHDNSDDCLFLESDEGRRAIVALHVEGIINYVLKRY